jgi:flagellar protein FlaF
MSVARYVATMAATQSLRDIEIRAFRHVNGLLAGAAEGDVLARATALRKNFQLWSILLSDLMLPTNKLPGDLKARLASLSLWAQTESNKALAEPYTSLEPLLVVNRAMVEGLEGQGTQRLPAVPAAAPAPASAPSRSLAASA